MSIWNIRTRDVDAFWNLIQAGTGASIGIQRLRDFGYPQRPEGVTVEFDLYPNSFPPNGFWDPVQEPHIEINFGGRYYMTPDDMSAEDRCAENNLDAAYPGD